MVVDKSIIGKFVLVAEIKVQATAQQLSFDGEQSTGQLIYNVLQNDGYLDYNGYIEDGFNFDTQLILTDDTANLYAQQTKDSLRNNIFYVP